MMAFLMGLKSVGPAELLPLVQAGAVTVIDVNSPARWQAAHVPGAINLDPHGYERAALPADPQAPLVFYCSNPMCRKAPQAARRARALGFANVRVLSAGITGWLDAGYPVDG
jgi:rhodanese-related sulfurtransferase